MSEVICHWSRRELAQNFELSHTYINNLVKEGKIPVTEHGIPIPEGIQALEKILKTDKPKRRLKEKQAEINTFYARVRIEKKIALSDLLDDVFKALEAETEDLIKTLLKRKTEEQIREAVEEYLFKVYEPFADRYDYLLQCSNEEETPENLLPD